MDQMTNDPGQGPSDAAEKDEAFRRAQDTRCPKAQANSKTRTAIKPR